MTTVGVSMFTRVFKFGHKKNNGRCLQKRLLHLTAAMGKHDKMTQMASTFDSSDCGSTLFLFSIAFWNDVVPRRRQPLQN